MARRKPDEWEEITEQYRTALRVVMEPNGLFLYERKGKNDLTKVGELVPYRPNIEVISFVEGTMRLRAGEVRNLGGDYFVVMDADRADHYYRLRR